MKNRLVLSLLALSAIAAPALRSTPAMAARTPNELGRIPVLEYHHFGTKEGRWTRTYDHFRQDLEFLHNNDYVAITALDLATGNINVPAGKKAVVLTFDDANEDQFKFVHDAQGHVRRNSRGVPMVDPQSAVGVLDAFASAHPDFGRAATFFVLPNAFGVPSEAGEKLRYLAATGREIANHTYSHPEFKKLTPAQITTELVKAQDAVTREIGHYYALKDLALPYGINPKDAAGKAALISGGSGAHAYKNFAVFLVGADPAPSPFDSKFNPIKVPRIQAIDDEFKRHFRRAPGSTGRVDEAFKPFVSDGNPQTVSVPAKLKDRVGHVGNRKVVTL